MKDGVINIVWDNVLWSDLKPVIKKRDDEHGTRILA